MAKSEGEAKGRAMRNRKHKARRCKEGHGSVKQGKATQDKEA